MSPDDKFIDTDVQFGVTRHLIGDYVLHENEKAPAPDVKGPWYSLEHTFVMEPGKSKLPRRADQRQGERRTAEDPASGVSGGRNVLRFVMTGASRHHARWRLPSAVTVNQEI